VAKSATSPRVRRIPGCTGDGLAASASRCMTERSDGMSSCGARRDEPHWVALFPTAEIWQLGMLPGVTETLSNRTKIELKSIRVSYFPRERGLL
jgi:hypothetical protein